ncbi:hypothetical protein WJ970_11770 [Achromobacter xylosoxidans]
MIDPDQAACPVVGLGVDHARMPRAGTVTGADSCCSRRRAA